jgi:hypothetical protein
MTSTGTAKKQTAATILDVLLATLNNEPAGSVGGYPQSMPKLNIL